MRICCPHRKEQRRGAQQRQQSGLVVGVPHLRGQILVRKQILVRENILVREQSGLVMGESDREHGIGLGLGLHPDTYALKRGGPHHTRALRPKRRARVRLHARDVPHEKEQKAICVAMAQKLSEVSAPVCFESKVNLMLTFEDLVPVLSSAMAARRLGSSGCTQRCMRSAS